MFCSFPPIKLLGKKNKNKNKTKKRKRCYLGLSELQRRCQCLALLLGANAAGDFKLKPMLIYYTILKILEPLRIMLNLFCIFFINETTKPGWQLLTTWFTEYFDPSIETYLSKKKKKSLSYYSKTMNPVTQDLWWRLQWD